MFRLSATVLAVGLGLSAARPSSQPPLLKVGVQQVPLNILDPQQMQVGKLRYRGGLALQAVEPRFGGLSDMRVIDGGRRIVAVSDCGSAFVARLLYDERGTLRDLADPHLRGLGGPGGRPLGRGEEDAESLALSPDGGLIVGFEQRHRLWRYPPGGEPFALPPDPLQMPPGSVTLDANQGFEAAVALEDGRLLVLSESATGKSRTAAGWIERGAVWQEFNLPLAYAPDAPDEPFRPTAAALLPGGDVLLLERRYPPVAVRIRRIARAALERSGDLEGTEVARFLPPLIVDNFEGLDASPGPDGELRIFVVSDDNDCAKSDHRHGTSLQRTLVLTFSLTD